MTLNLNTLGLYVLSKNPVQPVTPISSPSTVTNFVLHNWSERARISIDWRTDVSIGVTTDEERRSLVDRPYRSLTYQMTGITRDEAFKLLMNATRHTHTRSIVPLVTDYSKVTSSSSGSVINLDTSFRRFFVGARIIIHDWTNHRFPANVEFHTIVDISPSTITISGTLGKTYLAGSRVYPAMDVEVSLQQESRFVTDQVANFSLDLEEVVGPSALPTTASDVSYNIEINPEDGLPIFNLKPDWSVAPFSHMLVREGSIDFLGRAPHVVILGERGKNKFPINLIGLDRASAWEIITFFDSRKGRTRPFWFIPPTNLFSPTDIGVGFVDIDSSGNLQDLNDFLGSITIVLNTEENLIRQVTGVTDEGGGTWRISFTPTISGLITINSVRTIRLAYKCRLDKDGYQENWETNEVMSTQFEVLELLTEQDVAFTVAEDSLALSVPETIGNCTETSIGDLFLWCDAGFGTYSGSDSSQRVTPSVVLFPGADDDVTSSPAGVDLWDDARNLGGTRFIPFMNTVSSDHMLLINPTDLTLSNGRKILYLKDTNNYSYTIQNLTRIPWNNVAGTLQGITIFLVGYFETVSGACDFIECDVDGASGGLLRWRPTEVQFYQNGTSSGHDITYAGMPSSGPVQTALRWDPGVSADLYIGGSDLVYSAGSVLSSFGNGSGTSQNTVQWRGNPDMYIYSFMIFSRALDDGEMNEIGAYYKSLYGVEYTDI